MLGELELTHDPILHKADIQIDQPQREVKSAYYRNPDYAIEHHNSTLIGSCVFGLRAKMICLQAFLPVTATAAFVVCLAS